MHKPPSFRFIITAIAILFPLALLLADAAQACQFNTDCAIGSKCVKARGQIYGVCMAGMSPGNRNDRQPVYSPLDINRTYGDTCSFSTDCGPGSTCVKEAGRLYGTCLKRSTGTNLYRQDRDALGGCSYDLDCGLGWECRRSFGAAYGRCVPKQDDIPRFGNQDRSPGSCSSNFDCGLGAVCLKAQGQWTGVCVKR